HHWGRRNCRSGNNPAKSEERSTNQAKTDSRRGDRAGRSDRTQLLFGHPPGGCRRIYGAAGMTGISSERIASIEARRVELANAMASGDLAADEFVRLSKDYAAIEPVAAAAREVRRLRAELEVLQGMLHDSTSEPELKEMAEHEVEEIRRKLPEAERALALKLLPRDAADERAAML